MGVAGVTMPTVELSQMAPLYKVSANAYTFLIDNNGYVIYHPMLRPFVRVCR